MTENGSDFEMRRCLVVLATEKARVGYRAISIGANSILVEPRTPEAAEELAKLFRRSDWKQPGDYYDNDYFVRQVYGRLKFCKTIIETCKIVAGLSIDKKVNPQAPAYIKLALGACK